MALSETQLTPFRAQFDADVGPRSLWPTALTVRAAELECRQVLTLPLPWRSSAHDPRTGSSKPSSDPFHPLVDEELTPFDRKADPTQSIYYQTGIGTYNGHSKLKSGISAALDMAVGAGLGVHVRGGYEYLMQNYAEGDRGPSSSPLVRLMARW